MYLCTNFVCAKRTLTTVGAPDPEFCYLAGSGFRSTPDSDMPDPTGSGSEPDPNHLDPAGSGSSQIQI